jgi:hypothetical protein
VAERSGFSLNCDFHSLGQAALSIHPAITRKMHRKASCTIP